MDVLGFIYRVSFSGLLSLVSFVSLCLVPRCLRVRSAVSRASVFVSLVPVSLDQGFLSLSTITMFIVPLGMGVYPLYSQM